MTVKAVRRDNLYFGKVEKKSLYHIAFNYKKVVSFATQIDKAEGREF